MPSLKAAGVPRVIEPVQQPIKEDVQQPLQLEQPPMTVEIQP